MKINSDKISEQFRKYIIKLVLNKNNYVFTLWGTDLSNEDFDYLLINQQQKILAFSEIKNLLEFLKSNDFAIDNQNTQKWANQYKNNQAYTTYELDKIKTLISNPSFRIETLSKEDSFCLFNFYNLFSDYIYQTKIKEGLKLINNRDVMSFFDLVGSSLLWNNEGHENLIQSELQGFSSVNFIKNYQKILELFCDNILIQ